MVTAGKRSFKRGDAWAFSPAMFLPCPPDTCNLQANEKDTTRGILSAPAGGGILNGNSLRLLARGTIDTGRMEDGRAIRTYHQTCGKRRRTIFAFMEMTATRNQSQRDTNKRYTVDNNRRYAQGSRWHGTGRLRWHRIQSRTQCKNAKRGCHNQDEHNPYLKTAQKPQCTNDRRKKKLPADITCKR